MNNNSFKNASVKQLTQLVKNGSYVIPFFQRGYRWDEENVERLLNDIFEYSKNEIEKDYYLQPIVTKQDNNNYIIIDGQQRLTTIFLIFKYFKKNYSFNQKIYKITYEKGNNDKYINELLNGSLMYNNLNEYYLYKAYNKINNFFKSKSSKDINKFINYLYKKVIVIRYELDENEDEYDTFMRINTNKISLTKADIIKAELIRTDKRENIKMNRYEISTKWNKIENDLFNDNFWFFLDKNNTYDRMTKLLQIIINNKNNIYDVYKNKIDSNINNTWNIIIETYDIIYEWYNNIKLYNLIGYLICISKNKDIELLNELVREYKSKDKISFINYLKNYIKEKIFNKKSVDCIVNYEYGEDNDNIKKVILLYNIAILLENKPIRFPFKDFYYEKDKFNVKVNWDLEHIHPKIDKDDINNEDIIDLRTYLINRDLKNNKDIKEYITMDKNKLINILNNEFESLNSISNLVLLDSATNRNYKNAFFFNKRNKILEREEEALILSGTKRVFLKSFSNNITNNTQQMFAWDSIDSSNYLNDITTKINKLLTDEENGVDYE